MHQSLAAVDADLIQNLALGVSVGSVVVGLVLLKVISSIVGKVVSSAVMVALALAGWSQRTEISNCAEAIKEQAAPGATVEVKCTFFGQKIDIAVPIPEG